MRRIAQVFRYNPAEYWRNEELHPKENYTMTTEFTPRNPNFAEDVRLSFARQPAMELLGAQIVEVQAGYVELKLPFRNELTQQHGFFHGGIVASLADSAGGYSAMTLAEVGKTVLGVELKINWLAPADGDYLSARGQVIRAGRTLVVSQIEVFSVKGDTEKLCALQQMTTILVDTPEVD